MATIRQALEVASARLAASAAPSAANARRDAELLLKHLLDCDLAALLTHPNRPLSEAESARYETLLARRMAAEPIQYILGEQEFFGLNLRVTPEVLIPRPETEHLVEAVLERVARDQPLRIADVGTGSGAIAIALAHSLPRAELTALEISPEALAIAQKNAARHGLAARMRCLPSNLLAAVENEFFDAVVSNPPYIAENEDLEPQVRDYEPRAALYAGPTGLEVYERLIPQALGVLRPGGWLLLEIGYGQQAALSRLLAGWDAVRFAHDLHGIPRVAVARRSSDPSGTTFMPR